MKISSTVISRPQIQLHKPRQGKLLSSEIIPKKKLQTLADSFVKENNLTKKQLGFLIQALENPERINSSVSDKAIEYGMNGTLAGGALSALLWAITPPGALILAVYSAITLGSGLLGGTVGAVIEHGEKNTEEQKQQLVNQALEDLMGGKQEVEKAGGIEGVIQHFQKYPDLILKPLKAVHKKMT